MRKFVVHTRPLSGCCKTGSEPTIVEVEGDMIAPMEDPSVMWLPAGEFRFRIMQPESLHEPHEVKQEDGTKKKIMVPAVYHSHSVFYTEHQAMAHAIAMIRGEMEFAVRKGKRDSFTEEDVQEQVKLVQIVRLPNGTPST